MEITRFGSQAGFTLMELVVALAIISLLVGIAVPAITSLQDEARATKILAHADTMKKACQKHYTDTGTLATVRSDSTATQHHELFKPQSTNGWKGPYVDHLTTSGDNPFGGEVRIFESFSSGGLGGGFNLDGSGGVDVTGRGQFIRFSKIPEGIGKLVNDSLDTGIGGNWKTTGRVVWKPNAGGRLYIYLMDSK